MRLLAAWRLGFHLSPHSLSPTLSVNDLWVCLRLSHHPTQVNRATTPWIVVSFHFPMYTSYAG